MWSFAELQFYTLLITGQLLLIFSNIFDASLSLSAIYQNSVTTSCLGTPDIATCKWSTLLALKKFKGNKKTRSRVTFWGWHWLSEQKICSRSSGTDVLCEKCAVKYLELQLLSAISCCTTPQTFQSIVWYRGCSIITSRFSWCCVTEN